MDTFGVGNCLVIDDDFDLDHPDLNAGPRGTKPRDFARHPYGAVAGTAPFPKELLIPQDQWDTWMQREEEQQSSLEHIADAAGVAVKNQQQTNYCWVNAICHCVELLRAKQGEKYVELSPASVGAPITGFHNEGGYAADAVSYAAAHGFAPASLWPCNAIDKQYDTAAANAERPKYQIDLWWDLKPRTIPEVASCLLRRIPVGGGYNWWGHEITLVRLVKVNGVYGFKFDNSWGTGWGTRGRGVLTGNRMIPDDAIAPRVVTAA